MQNEAFSIVVHCDRTRNRRMTGQIERIRPADFLFSITECVNHWKGSIYTCLVLIAGGSGDFWREGSSRRKGSRGWSRPCWPARTGRAEGRTRSSRTVGQLVGKLWILRHLRLQPPAAPSPPRVAISVLVPCTLKMVQLPISACSFKQGEGGWLFLFLLPTPHLGATEGSIGRRRKRQGYLDVPSTLRRGKKNPKKQLCQSQTFYTNCTQSQQLHNTRSTDETWFVCNDSESVYTLFCHCNWRSLRTF